MRRTIENDFELTGPIARGDRETVERHLEAIRGAAPSRAALRGARGGDAPVKVIRTIDELGPSSRRGHDRPRADDGRAP